MTDSDGVKMLPDDEETYQIGLRDGYDRAVQDIDLLTGGDGEYRYCTNHDPERHCPDAATMKARIAERLATRPPVATDEVVERYPHELRISFLGNKPVKAIIEGVEFVPASMPAVVSGGQK